MMDFILGASTSNDVPRRIVTAIVAIFLVLALSSLPEERTTQGLRLRMKNVFEVLSQKSVANDRFGLTMIPDPPITTPPLESQFEHLWPGYKLPPWAKKPYNYKVPRNQSICFVHVGKAGGSAVGCDLGFSLHCKNTTQADGILPKITTAVFHKDVYNCEDDSAYYLFVIRDPIDRARSAFNYEKPRSKGARKKARFVEYYDHCSFSTIDDMAQNGLSDRGNATDHCKTLARNGIKGQEWISPSHFYYNYQYYSESIPKNSPIIVIRNEHLYDDWNTLEAHLSGKNDVISEKSMPKINANTHIDQDDLYISSESLELLCQALCNEIQVYKKILTLAQNLNADQVIKSFDALSLKCPIETKLDSCPEPMPDIKRKLKSCRGYYSPG